MKYSLQIEISVASICWLTLLPTNNSWSEYLHQASPMRSMVSQCGLNLPGSVSNLMMVLNLSLSRVLCCHVILQLVPTKLDPALVQFIFSVFWNSLHMLVLPMAKRTSYWQGLGLNCCLFLCQFLGCLVLMDDDVS